MELLNEIYTTEGRLNRLAYLKYQVIWTIISAVIGFILGFTEFGRLSRASVVLCSVFAACTI